MPEIIDFRMQDVVRLRKAHPCGGFEWEVVRLGADIGLRCRTCGHRVLLWGRDASAVRRMAAERVNARYLPGTALPATIEPVAAMEDAHGAEEVVVAVPSHAFRDTLAALGPQVGRIAWATKGLEESSGRLLHEIAAEIVGSDASLAALSGPTFAAEVARGLPTAITVASNDSVYADRLAEALHCGSFRAYTSTDLVGVGFGGAVKNVIAIAAGMADGLGLGANSRAALITRGLAEMMRLGQKLGVRTETMMGLAGLGDLVLTCTDDKSRNRRFGQAGSPYSRGDRRLACRDRVLGKGRNSDRRAACRHECGAAPHQLAPTITGSSFTADATCAGVELPV